MEVKGFEFIVGEKTKFLTINNTSHSGFVTFTQSDGTKFDITETDFIRFATMCNREAERMKQRIAEAIPKSTVKESKLETVTAVKPKRKYTKKTQTTEKKEG